MAKGGLRLLRVPVLSAPFTRSATMRAGDANQLILLSSATLPIDLALQLSKGNRTAPRNRSEAAKVIEGTAETVALPAPDVALDGSNKVMDAADTASGPRERKPRKREGGRG
jgi:hypothetical protein